MHKISENTLKHDIIPGRSQLTRNKRKQSTQPFSSFLFCSLLLLTTISNLYPTLKIYLPWQNQSSFPFLGSPAPINRVTELKTIQEDKSPLQWKKIKIAIEYRLSNSIALIRGVEKGARLQLHSPMSGVCVVGSGGKQVWSRSRHFLLSNTWMFHRRYDIYCPQPVSGID